MINGLKSVARSAREIVSHNLLDSSCPRYNIQSDQTFDRTTTDFLICSPRWSAMHDTTFENYNYNLVTSLWQPEVEFRLLRFTYFAIRNYAVCVRTKSSALIAQNDYSAGACAHFRTNSNYILTSNSNPEVEFDMHDTGRCIQQTGRWFHVGTRVATISRREWRPRWVSSRPLPCLYLSCSFQLPSTLQRLKAASGQKLSPNFLQ